MALVETEPRYIASTWRFVYIGASSQEVFMPARDILLLGNPILRQQCRNVKSPSAEKTRTIIADLRDTLAEFRSKRGFGRGIAAPQIGSDQKVIYINFDYVGPLINPAIVRRSRKRFRLWDDCFSFPDILAYVQRNYSIEVSFLDEKGKRKKLKAEGALSELLQHEIDHLNGVLAVDRAIDSKHIILRSEFEKLSHKTPVGL
jgi:peptide deformylase